MITALGGSRCSSSGSTRNSRERWTVRPSDSLSPIARDVVTPQDVLVLIPSVSEPVSLVPRDSLSSVLSEPDRGASGAPPGRARLRPWLRPELRLCDRLRDADRAVPTVEV